MILIHYCAELPRAFEVDVGLARIEQAEWCGLVGQQNYIALQFVAFPMGPHHLQVSSRLSYCYVRLVVRVVYFWNLSQKQQDAIGMFKSVALIETATVLLSAEASHSGTRNWNTTPHHTKLLGPAEARVIDLWLTRTCGAL